MALLAICIACPVNRTAGIAPPPRTLSPREMALPRHARTDFKLADSAKVPAYTTQSARRMATPKDSSHAASPY